MTDQEKKEYEDFCDLADRKGVPEHLVGGLYRYVRHGINPGDFLTAVLSNDLKGAMAHGDNNSLAGLVPLFRFIYNDLPGICWGSVDKMNKWVEVTRK